MMVTRTLKKAVGLISKTTLQVQHTLQYITLLSLHNFNFNVKFPSFTFNGERRRKTQIFLALNLGKFFGVGLLGEF